jgi:hypothetical protein
VATVRTSPGPSTGSTCSVDSVSFSPRPDVNASHRPSGDHAGWPSRGPAVIGAGSPFGPASQTWLTVRFSASSMVATEKAIDRPSGETAGDEADERRSSRRAAISPCGDASGGATVPQHRDRAPA